MDYRRFQSASLLECYLLEKAEIEKYDTTTPITTNFHGVPNNDIDYFKWAKHTKMSSHMIAIRNMIHQLMRRPFGLI